MDYNKGIALKASVEEGTGVTFRVNRETITACVESEYQAATSNAGGERGVTASVGKFLLKICNPLVTNVVETRKFKITWQNGTNNGNFIGPGYKIGMLSAGLDAPTVPQSKL